MKTSLPPRAHSLAEKIKSRKAKVAVIGLGYVGMPLVRALLRKGFPVVGVDRDKERVRILKSGKSLVETGSAVSTVLEGGETFPGGVLPAEISPFLKKKKLTLTSSFADVKHADVVVICTPTPLGKHEEPDLSFIKDPAKKIGQLLKKGALVVLESTSYPGTTRELLEFFEPKYKLGTDLFLGFSPERIDPGNKTWTLENIPKIVSGLDDASRELVHLFYSQFIATVHPVSSPEVAETAKLLENIFRLVNISLVNELALLADKMGVDIWEVIEAAKTKPYGFMPFYPSSGAGGHCIPLDPLYLAWKAREYHFYPRFIELAGEVNNLMPDFGVTKITYVLNRVGKAMRGAKIFFIGVTYKKDVADVRESSALKVLGKIIHKGAQVEFYDPYVRKVEVEDPFQKDSTGAHILESVPFSKRAVKDADCVVIAVDHTNLDYDVIAREAKMIVDLRNAMYGKKTKGEVFHL
jgi:UDP-N-acetyl-D-glucosamine dehydrogenase